MTAPNITPFHQNHIEAGGKLVDFAGWELPVNYGSQIAEHEAVRTDAGMFDVSHMLVTDVAGEQAKAFFRKLLANDVDKLAFVGKALYSALLNDNGGVIDDLIVYRMNEAETQYRIVSNGATREKDSAQFQKIGQAFGVNLTPRTDLAMLAVQGPKAVEKLLTVKPEWAEQVNALKPFQGHNFGGNWFVARTGYTGEDGVEVILPATEASEFFKALQAAGVQPCGLGARDTLRMEAGMNLYGNDMDDDTSPLEAGMSWTVDLKDEARDFVGKVAVVALKEKGVAVKQVGLLLDKGGVLRAGMEVVTDKGNGITTSGVFSPSLKQSIAIARLPKDFDGEAAKVLIRGKEVDVRVLKLPFVRNGQKQFD
ncbi:glycine cleavage system protein T [Neisseria sp. N95_16]|uniref:Aminomethyltransferase n=1 Tax=Neisseria brasiliensis TaxID=2666100 RepID=A0A5Q3RX61_9NEIS|nr:MULTISPECIES: glycine cleavage system aminomethyltransferase GcvT [Neisseria]MRN37541.1 glycine cleavage system aminomethyltransferase GcvT [Neisseria brasiliensis]PJO09192.1 glycine cleavage system protein T [Neisseria sp. N95_16]PJO79332.1 glycine cleavage system protein T [Neisseria sp. N177_16]QGL24529.1 glycine cleavage system aminomethyltransferase GcvT [Neisseria brasiliensis]